MKITDVKAWVVEPQGPFWGSTMDRQWTFVRIDTDEGIHGWGEATSSPRRGSFLTAQAVLAMKEALVGEDPVNIEPLWHKLYRRYTYMGSRGLPTTAISGIDIALWDIKGKALGVPIYELLGGKFRDEVRLYANGYFAGCSTPEEYGEAAKRVKESGHEALKLDPFLEMRPYHTAYQMGQISQEGEQLGYDIVRATREAVGPQFDILIDAHGHYNVPVAIRLANNLYEQSRIEWFEEPLPPEGFAGLETIRAHTEPNICVGERLFTRVGFPARVPQESCGLYHAGHRLDGRYQRDSEDCDNGGGVLHSYKSAQRDGFVAGGGWCARGDVDGELLSTGALDSVDPCLQRDVGGADRFPWSVCEGFG